MQRIIANALAKLTRASNVFYRRPDCDAIESFPLTNIAKICPSFQAKHVKLDPLDDLT